MGRASISAIKNAGTGFEDNFVGMGIREPKSDDKRM
jgi:hypothetical protein